MNVLRLNNIKQSADGIPPRFIGNVQMIRAHLLPAELKSFALSAKGRCDGLRRQGNVIERHTTVCCF